MVSSKGDSRPIFVFKLKGSFWMMSSRIDISSCEFFIREQHKVPKSRFNSSDVALLLTRFASPFIKQGTSREKKTASRKRENNPHV
ncbi:hypothetical protein CDAR_615631 [Caerostris darwini]|uniref:Uncharacterized protein n=1 Tax=Caerostris darwini TaxID=1538125 RepID=A0AAV4RYJ6_9ARAC|nr:hypothetical protein CDAR_615631 [Caerostris darwini]